jgi:hypothetical protein
MPSRRSAILYYVLLMLSGGLFLYYWIYLIMKDLNRIYDRELFNINRISIIFIIVFSIYMVLVFYVMALLINQVDTPNYVQDFITILSISLTVATLWVICKCYKIASVAANRVPGAGGYVLVIFLSLLTFISLPFIQIRINSLLPDKSGRTLATG